MYYHYSPQPPQEYMPADKPFAVMWHGYTTLFAEAAPSSYGVWNLLWLMSPDLERSLGFSREYNPDWDTVKVDVTFAMLHKLWPDLMLKAAEHPTRLRTFLRQNEDHFYLQHSPAGKLDFLRERLDDAVAWAAETYGPDGPPLYELSFHPRKEGNVVYLNPRVVQRREI